MSDLVKKRKRKTVVDRELKMMRNYGSIQSFRTRLRIVSDEYV
jgi:hypothetical protein